MTSRATQSSLKRIGSRAPLTVQQCWLPFIRATSPPPHEGFDRGCRDVGYWAPARSITDAARVRFSSRSSFLRVALIHSKSRAPRDRSSSFSFSLSSSSLSSRLPSFSLAKLSWYLERLVLDAYRSV